MKVLVYYGELDTLLDFILLKIDQTYGKIEKKTILNFYLIYLDQFLHDVNLISG